MKHIAVDTFWKLFNKLPIEIQSIANKNFELLKSNPNHFSLHFKKVNKYHSIRIGLKHRAFGIEKDKDIIWFLIGTHNDYDKLLGNR